MRTQDRRATRSISVADRRQRARRSARRVSLAAALCIVGVVAGACGSGATEAGDASTGNVSFAAGQTRQGGEVTFVTVGLGGQFDPVAAQAFGFVTGGPMNAMFGLMTYHDPASNTIKMGWLKSLTHNADYTVWTGKLPPNLKFSDGTPFNADAVVFNLKRAADPTTGSLFVASAKEITPAAVDDTTFTMTLAHPNVHFDAVYTENFPYVGSPTAIRKAGAKVGTQPVGAGPFKLQSIDGTNSVTLVPNPYYAQYKPGEPRLSKITFQSIADQPKEAQALAANQAQMAGPTGGDAVKMFQRSPNLNVMVNKTGAGSDLQMSMKRPPFNDVRAREAITLALDRKAVANAFAPGTPPQTNLFTPDSPYYDPKYDYPKQDKAKAQQLFDELAAEGKPVNFAYLVPDAPNPVNLAQLVLSELSAFKNVKMTINTETPAQYIADQHAGNYQMTPVGLYLVNPIPELELQFGTGGSLNTMGYSNPKVDAAFADLHTQADPKKQVEDYGIIQEQLIADSAIYWCGQGILGFAVNKDLVNVTPVNYGIAPLWGPLGYKK